MNAARINGQPIATWTLPLRLAPLLNQLHRMHWAQRVALKRECATRLLVQNGRRSEPLRGRPLVVVTRFSSKLPDADSGQGAKLALDALRDLGWIRDDSPQHIQLKLQAFRAAPRKGYLSVAIWEAA